MPTEICNTGAVDASDVFVRFFAGNPDQGGSVIHDEVFAGPITPGACVSRNVVMDNYPGCTPVLVYALVDADDSIEECNDGNNLAVAAGTVECCNQ